MACNDRFLIKRKSFYSYQVSFVLFTYDCSTRIQIKPDKVQMTIFRKRMYCCCEHENLELQGIIDKRMLWLCSLVVSCYLLQAKAMGQVKRRTIYLKIIDCTFLSFVVVDL